MEMKEQQYIHKLLETKNDLELYQTYTDVIHQMLLIESYEEFQDFLCEEEGFDEDVFALYHAANHGECLMIGGYDEDVSQKVASFLKTKLSQAAFGTIEKQCDDMYVDLGTRDTLEESIEVCNQMLNAYGHRIKMDFEDTYCDGTYFLFVESI